MSKDLIEFAEWLDNKGLLNKVAFTKYTDADGFIQSSPKLVKLDVKQLVDEFNITKLAKRHTSDDLEGIDEDADLM